MNGLNLIQQQYSSMSPAEKRIADCILKDPALVTKSTLVFLAKEAGVSPGSITNFAASLGFSGFSQLKINLAQNLPAEGEVRAGAGSGQNRVLRSMIESARSSFEATLETVSEGDFSEAAGILAGAGRIIVIGFAYSAPVAEDLAFRLMALGLPAQAMTDSLAADLACSSLGERGVLLAVSHSGRTKEVLRCAQTAKQAGARILSLTSYAKSPLAELSDIHFVAVSNEALNYQVSMTARLTHLLLGDYLLELTAERIGAGAVERVDSILDVLEQNREAIRGGD